MAQDSNRQRLGFYLHTGSKPASLRTSIHDVKTPTLNFPWTDTTVCNPTYHDKESKTKSISGGSCHKRTFVVTKDVSQQSYVCCDKNTLVTIKALLRQAYFCCDKRRALSQQTRVWRNKNDTCGSSRQWYKSASQARWITCKTKSVILHTIINYGTTITFGNCDSYTSKCKSCPVSLDWPHVPPCTASAPVLHTGDTLHRCDSCGELQYTCCHDNKTAHRTYT